MDNPAKKALYQAAALIFEELSFLLPSPSTGAIGDAPAAGSSVAFQGPFSGVLVLRVTRNILSVLSANMLGDDLPPDENTDRDAVGEIANVICGNLLPSISDPEAVFRLESPRFFEGPVPADLDPDAALEAEIHIGLDNGQADVMLFVSLQ